MAENEVQLTPEQARQVQNIAGAIFIFVGIYYFAKVNFDLFNSVILIIIGFGLSKDARNLVLFGLKWVFAKILKKPTPTYDFSHAKIEQHGKHNIINNGGTVNLKN